jgi:beta-glucosidase
MSCRAIGKYAGGYVSGQMVEDLVLMWGGHFFLGFGRLIRDFFRNRRKNRAFTKKLKEVR